VLVLVGASNRDKSPWLSYPRPSHSAHLFLLFFAWVGGVLAHLLTTFVNGLDFPIHPSALKILGLFFSSFIACVNLLIVLNPDRTRTNPNYCSFLSPNQTIHRFPSLNQTELIHKQKMRSNHTNPKFQTG